jgi:hypothetical protein
LDGVHQLGEGLGHLVALALDTLVLASQLLEVPAQLGRVSAKSLALPLEIADFHSFAAREKGRQVGE